MKQIYILYFAAREYLKCWSDCTDAQTGLHLLLFTCSKVRFSRIEAHMWSSRDKTNLIEKSFVFLVSSGSLCGSSSRCNGFVCNLWLWYFQIILTIFEFLIRFILITHVYISKLLKFWYLLQRLPGNTQSCLADTNLNKRTSGPEACSIMPVLAGTHCTSTPYTWWYNRIFTSKSWYKTQRHVRGWIRVSWRCFDVYRQ